MDNRLVAYLNSVRQLPFRWGVHDCLTFANRCAEIQGRGFADEWIGGYNSARAAFARYVREQRRHTDYKTIIDVADDRMHREATLNPQFGMIAARQVENVAIGYAFGVSTGTYLAFVGAAGLELLTPQSGDLFWSVVK